MKRFLFIISVLLVGIISTAEVKVPLEGTLNGGNPKSQSQSQPVEVLQSESELIVNFFDCIGNLIVEVINENGITVYSETVNTCTTNTITIKTKGWDAGNYVIRISDVGSGFMEGGFVI